MTTRFLYLNTRDEFYRVDISKIAYFESDGNFITFVCQNGQKGVICMSLKHMQKHLTDSLGNDAKIFARIGKRFIINLTFIYKISMLKQQLVLSDGVTFSHQLPISKDALRNLRDMIIQRMKSA